MKFIMNEKATHLEREIAALEALPDDAFTPPTLRR